MLRNICGVVRNDVESPVKGFNAGLARRYCLHQWCCSQMLTCHFNSRLSAMLHFGS